MNFMKHIHQIWLQGKDEIPEKFNSNIEQIKNLHPDWKYTLWDDLEIIRLLRSTDNNNSFDKSLIKIYYQLQHLHQKVDFARYVILYKYGGIYVDMDAKNIKSLDNIISKYEDYEIIVCKLNLNSIENYITTGSNTTINNGVIISKKNSMFLKKLIQKIIDDHECNGWIRSIKVFCINDTTGPKRFTQAIYDYSKQSKFTNDHRVKILDYEYFEPCVVQDCNITENTYFIHHHERSWLSPTTNNFLTLSYTNKKLIILFIILIVISIFIIFKTNQNKL